MKVKLIFVLVIGVGSRVAYAQQQSLSLKQVIDSALINNHYIKIKSSQIAEKQSKVKEDKIKRYPSLIASSTYQYNANIAQLVIPAGSFGALPINPTTTIALPGDNKALEVGKHDNFNAGISLYQPLTQQFKINTAIEIAKSEESIAEQEKSKFILHLRQSVEKIFYGLLIASMQKEEAQAKLELAQIKLYDVESAILAGKALDIDKVGLQASLADEEQNLLKLTIQEEDYWLDLQRATGIRRNDYRLEPVEIEIEEIFSETKLDEDKLTASQYNQDIQIAKLNLQKANLGISAARQSYLPDVGIIAGYSYQTGNVLLPKYSPYAGLNLRWNLQDLLSNSQVSNQRVASALQSLENLANVKEQANSDIEKAHKKLEQSKALIAVAQKVLHYRESELQIQTDKQDYGLAVRSAILNTKALVAKAKADLFAARLAYRLSQNDLTMLLGK